MLLALSRDTPPGLQGLLFGDVLGVSDTDLALAAGLAVVTLVALTLLHGRLLVVGFDRLSARGLGVRPLVADVALLGLLALALLVAVQGLGNLLVVAVLIAPAAGARLLARRMAPMMAAAAAIAVASGLGGLYLSYYAGTAAGASIAAVLVATWALIGLGHALLGAREPGDGGRRPRRVGDLGVAAGAAGAVEHDVVLGDLERHPARDAVDRPLELGVLERCHRPARVADEVMVVVTAAGVQRLVADDALAELDARPRA